MQIRTKEGIAEPLPLSDIQKNNRLLRIVIIVITIWTLVGLWLIYKVISDNVINNIVAKCIC